MNVKDLQIGKTYICSMCGRYGSTPAKYLGKEECTAGTAYDFYDGETDCVNIATARQTLTGQMSIMHFTEKNVRDHIFETDNVGTEAL